MKYSLMNEEIGPGAKSIIWKDSLSGNLHSKLFNTENYHND